MYLTNVNVELMTECNQEQVLKHIEECTRKCYNSENLINENSYERIINNIKKNNHLAMLEHYSLSFKIRCSRGISMEIIRHRIASYAQRSTRYVNSSKKGFNIINPYWSKLQLGKYDFIDAKGEIFKPDLILFNGEEYWSSYIEFEWKQPEIMFLRHCLQSEIMYNQLIDKYPPEALKCFLPDCFETELVITANLRSLMNFLDLRYYQTTGKVHPEMLEVSTQMNNILSEKLPMIFKR